jgi:uncharacterized protein
LQVAWSKVVVCAALFVCAASAGAFSMETVAIPMRDGAQLYATVIFPGNPQTEGPWPVILQRNIYGRTLAVTAYLDVFKGYVSVIAELRGRGDSDGEFRFFEDDGWGARQDGADTVAWIHNQPWCNGHIGTFGGSALGAVQTLLAGASQEVTAQVIEAAPSNFYAHLFYQGGVPRRALIEQSLLLLGQSPQDVFQWKLHPAYDDYWRQFNADARAELITAPGLHIGGWWDMFLNATLDHYRARQYHGGPGARGNQKLFLRATTHAPFPPGMPFNPPEPFQVFDAGNDLVDRFYAHWLKGDDTGLHDEPNVYYYVIGDDTAHDGPGWEWRTARHWPPFPPNPMPFYLSADKTLRANLNAVWPGCHAFWFNPRNPVPSLGGADLFGFGANRYFGWGPWDQRALHNRNDILRFQSAPLTEPMEITGAVSVRLFVSSDAVDTDFTAKLLDIYPTGDEREILMLDGIQRVKFRNGYETPAPPLAPGEIVELEIDLAAISLIFNTGHRIGVHISSSNFPRYEVNPNNGDDFPGARPSLVARNTVHTGPAYPSAILLPVRRPHLDTDGDGLPDELEWEHDLDLNNPDTDGDGLPDGWEFYHGLDPLSADGDDGADGDPDGDGFTNEEEYQRGSHPLIPEGQGPGCHGAAAGAASPPPRDVLALTVCALLALWRVQGTRRLGCPAHLR